MNSHGVGRLLHEYLEDTRKDLKFGDSVSLVFGNGATTGEGNAGDVEVRWDGTDLDWLPTADDTVMKFGSGTLNFDVWIYGNAATDYVLFDASAGLMTFTGAYGMNPGVVTVTDAATYTVLATDSGKLHVIPNLSASCTITLPTGVAGLTYTFIGKAVAADGENWIFSTGGTAFLGGVSFADTDAGAAGDEIHAGIWPNGSSNDFLTVVTPGAGTRVTFVHDGTNWIVNGQVFSATVPAFSDT